MATGRSMQITKQIGEYLVSAELCRRGFIATTFTGNVPEFDILAINNERIIIPVQVKTIQGGNWQFNARKLLDISISNNGTQTIHGKKNVQNPDLICVFVKLFPKGNDEFYVFSLKDLQDILFEGHSKWLRAHGGKRPRNPESMHISVSAEALSNYRNNWDLLEK